MTREHPVYGLKAADQLATSKERLIAALEDYTESIDPCEWEHVEHGPEAHFGERRVHAMLGSFGADWSYEAAVAFIRAAVRVNIAPFGSRADITGHRGSAMSKGDQWVAFATKPGATL